MTASRLVPSALLLLYGLVCVLRQEAFVFEYTPLSRLIDPSAAGLGATLAGLRYVLFGAAGMAWAWDRPLAPAMEMVRVMAVIHGLVGGFVLFVMAALLT